MYYMGLIGLFICTLIVFLIFTNGYITLGNKWFEFEWSVKIIKERLNKILR